VRNFRGCFTRALFIASVIFVLAHGLQTLAIALAPQNHLPRAEVFTPTMPLLGLAEGLIYFVIGWPLAYGPIYVISRLPQFSTRRTLIVFLLAGFALGLLSLPLGAGVPFLVLRSSPTYLFWCVQYAYPMTFAGVLGGYAFWRFARRTARQDEQLVHQFS
jgi:hypothetical protein